MSRKYGLADEPITLAAGHDVGATPATGEGGAMGTAAGPASEAASAPAIGALAAPYDSTRVWNGFATLASPTTDLGPLIGSDYLSGLSASQQSLAFAFVNLGASSTGAGAMASTAASAVDPLAAPSGGAFTASPSPDLAATGPGGSQTPGFSKTALATTQPHQIDFSAQNVPVFGSNASFFFSLPSELFQSFSFNTGVSVAGFGVSAGVSIMGGIKGSVALSLGQFSPNYPVTIDPNVVPFVQDGQVFTIDPTLVSTNDAQFSLSLPQAHASLEFGLQASAGVTVSFPGIPIGFSLPFVGFVGYTLRIPSQFIGTKVGSLYNLPSNATISIPGDGSIMISELQAKSVLSGTQSAYEGLPTLEASGNTDPFIVANTDLVSILAQEVPDPFAVLQGSKGYSGVASISYKLLSLPLSGSLWLHEDVTLTPIAITETVTDTLTGVSQTGTLGQSFTFSTPTSGTGIVPLSISFGLELSVHTSLELDGNVKLTLEGPSVSGSILGLGATLGPLGNFNLLDISGKIAELYSNTFTETLTTTDTVDVQNFQTPVVQTISTQSGAVALNKPATNLVVTAAGTISGAAFGVRTGTLSAAMVTDYGLITATGDGVDLQQGGTVDVQAGGRIIGHGANPGTGVQAIANPPEAVINSGAITGFSQGVTLGAGTVKNETGAVINATSVGVSIASANGQIVNNGSIGAATAVSLTLGGSVYNALSGTISGGRYGVYGGAGLSVENHCTLTGGVDGVRGLAGGSVTNLAGAYVHGGAVGVVLSGGTNAQVVNGVGGEITGGKVGVALSGVYTTLTDSGLISGSLDAVQLYGSMSNTLVLDPNAQVLGGVRMTAVNNTISLTGGSGVVGTLAGLGTVLPLQATIDIVQGAAWDISGDFTGLQLVGFNRSDALNDTAIAYQVGERVVLNRRTDVLDVLAAGSPLSPIGTIQLYGQVPTYGFTLTADANKGIDITFPKQKQSLISANNGEVDIGPTGIFSTDLTIAAGVTVSANYYGDGAQSFGVYANQERATVTNYGTILGAQSGVDLSSGGLLTNEAGALISGATGVRIGSNSVDKTDAVTLINLGTVTTQLSTSAVYVLSSGTVSNLAGGLVTSTYLNGVQLNAFATVSNQGTISGGRSGVRGFYGGFVYNQAGGLVTGRNLFGVEITGGYGKVINCGSITSAQLAGVSLGDGGLLINETGTISGASVGVQIAGAAGNVANGALIQGVLLEDGGTIVNGTKGVISAAAAGYGVSFYNSAGPVAAYLHNMGRIDGVLAFGADLIVNDGTIDGAGVAAGSAGGVTLKNLGLIQGAGGVSVNFTAASDRLIVGTGADFIGAVHGGGGTLDLAAASGTITGLGGSGTLSGGAAMTFSGFGSYLIDASGSWTLSGANKLAAKQSLSVAGSLTNKGALSGGVTLLAGGSVGNAATAAITGQIGVIAGVGGAATLTNFGTITGTGGTAVQFQAAGDRLIAEVGSHFFGAVKGGGGTLELAGGTGTITGLGVVGKVSGAEAITVSGFGSYQIDAGGTWTLGGANLIAAGATLTDFGSLTGLGALTVQGLLTDARNLSLQGGVINSGVIALDATGGAANLALAANTTLTGGGAISLGPGVFKRIYGASNAVVLDNVDNTIAGSGVIGLGKLTLINGAKGVINASGGHGIEIDTIGKTLVNAGLIEATGGARLTLFNTVVDDTGGGTLSAANGAIIGLAGGVIEGGVLTTSGTGAILTTAGRDVLDGTTQAVTNAGMVIINDGTNLTVEGAVHNTGTIVVRATSHVAHLVIDGSGLTLDGGGRVILSNDAFSAIVGVSAATTLTNVDNTITGAGQIGAASLALVNGAKGMIASTGSVGLILNTGTNTITNAGVIEANSQALTVKSALTNTGMLEAVKATLILGAGVTGSGFAVINGGTLAALSSFSEAVSFVGGTGRLQLAQSRGYTGTITGFSTKGGTTLDLRDIAFKNAGEATFSGNGAGGVLTVTDGTHTARITLSGAYLGSTFVAASDGQGGVLVTDPAAPRSQAFAAAMAGMGPAGTALIGSTPPSASPSPSLAAPPRHV